MEPITLIAIAAAAGFVFKKFSSQAKRNNELNREELTYSKDIIARSNIEKKTKEIIPDIDILPEYILIKKLVEKEFPLIFVTGGAGTGKSTFVKWLVTEFKGAVLLGAPTAIAAINIHGKTLHSICQLPPAFIVKKDIKITPRKREIKEAKLLVIDEVSMVNANLLDGVSYFFRINRGVNKPFGGLPVILVGDMFQLPPVVSQSQKELFEEIYGSAKFYNAKCLSGLEHYAVELNKTFRQTDQYFVNLLTKIREGVDLNRTLKQLNDNTQILEFAPKGSVWLAPTNSQVDTRNHEELKKIKTKSKLYRGSIEGDFKVDRLPSPMELILKIGAQVMFVNNDIKKQWINGTVGKVMDLDEDKIVVRLYETNTNVDVHRIKWTDYYYRWNSSERTIERKSVGEYCQFPLVLAWSMTIHKSQGRTIEKVHLDLEREIFETGQAYVALSRCRSVKGLSMTRMLNPSDILVDEESKDYYQNLRSLIEKLPPEEMMKNIESMDSIPNA